jgi:hypothetical protein
MRADYAECWMRVSEKALLGTSVNWGKKKGSRPFGAQPSKPPFY